MQALKLPAAVHAGSRRGPALIPDNSSHVAHASRKAALRANIPKGGLEVLSQRRPLQPTSPVSIRSSSVVCHYRPDRSADEIAEESKPSSSGTEAAAVNELAADAAAQAATDQLQDNSTTTTASVEGAETAAVAAGSVAQRGPSSDNQQGRHGHHQQHEHHHNNSSKKHKSGDEQTPSQRLQARLDNMGSQYQELDSRLDTLENTLVTLLSSVKERARRPAIAASVGPGGAAAVQGAGGAPVAEATEGDVPEYDYESDDEHSGLFDLKKLQSSLSENINKGYLESVKHLREMLMAYEWHLHGKELAERKGVAAFEKHCAEHDLDIEFDVLTQLYSNPNDLSVLPNNKLKLLARSIIQQAVDERYCNIYFECTNTAKELAKTGLKDIIPDSAGKVGGVIRDILPVPGFLKK